MAHHFSSILFWFALQLIILIIVSVLVLYQQRRSTIPLNLVSVPMQFDIVRLRNITKELARLNHFQQVLLAATLFTCIVVSFANGYLVCTYAPNNWDSMTYHLARVAYFLQHNSLASYPANYWAQTIHAKNSTVILSYVHILGLPENFFQLPQFLAYWITIIAVYGCSNIFLSKRYAALWVALMFGLLVEVLMQATTTQNDLIMTAVTGSSLFFLLRFRQSGNTKNLILTTLCIGVALGLKSSSLLLVPSIAVIAAYCLQILKPGGMRRLAQFTGLSIIGILLFTLPSGYIDNLSKYGHPIGPHNVRTTHSFEGKPISYIARNGAKNLLRFTVDSLSLDCRIPSWTVYQMHDRIRGLIKTILLTTKVDLTTDEASRETFRYEKGMLSHEDHSYWGITGFALCLPLVLLTMVSPSTPPLPRAFAIAGVLFVVLQAFCGPYDPWRGRYFIILAPFALPVIGGCFDTRRLLAKAYVLSVVAMACISAVCAVAFRTNRPLIAYESNNSIRVVSPGDRLSQMLSNQKFLLPDIREYEKRVPQDAVVAVAFPGNMYEYPLFGKNLSRTIIPVKHLRIGNRLHELPADANFLLYPKGYIKMDPNDIVLGKELRLRSL